LHFDPITLLDGPYGQLIFQGLVTTLALAAGAWLLAMFLGLLLAVIRLTEHKWVRTLVSAYVEYHRNVPTLVQLIVWYFGIPALFSRGVQIWLGRHHPEFLSAMVALGMCQAAYFSEDIRSGLRALGAGQSEGSRSLGMTYLSSMRHVILPQAIRHAAPALVNDSVLLFKNTSLAMVIGLAELTYAVRNVDSQTFRTFDCYFIATVLYLMGSLLLMALARGIETRYGSSRATA
jgi:polar amino acid transport system permease protein